MIGLWGLGGAERLYLGLGFLFWGMVALGPMGWFTGGFFRVDPPWIGFPEP